MSGVGSTELILLLVIGLIVLGPRRLPEIANTVGGWIGQARRMTRVLRRQLEEELRLDEKPAIKPPPAQHMSATEPAPPEAHVPSDDDTYSPLHDEDDATTKEQDT